MAGPIVRTFWIVEGKVDKDGHPIEFPSEAAAKAQSSAGGIAGTGIGQGLPVVGGAPKPATKVTESMTEDGEYVQTIDGPDGQPQEIGRGVDKARLDLYKARQEAGKQPKADDRYEYRNGPNGELLKIDKQTGAVTVEMSKSQGPQQDENKPVEVGGQLVQKQPDGSYKPVYTPATKPAAGNAPALNLPATRPGQLTDLSLVESQANQFIAGVNADTTLTPQQRQAKISTYLDTVVKPAAEQATKEANDYALQQQQRQRDADARAAAAVARQDTTAERQTRTAEAAQRLNEEKFSYERGQDAVSNRLKLLEREVDPSFGPDLAGIYNRIIPGAFQPGSFTTQAPDLDAIAAAHVGPILDLHNAPVAQPGAQGVASAGVAAPAVPPAFGPRTAPPYPQPGGTGMVGRFGQ